MTDLLLLFHLLLLRRQLVEGLYSGKRDMIDGEWILGNKFYIINSKKLVENKHFIGYSDNRDELNIPMYCCLDELVTFEYIWRGHNF